MKTTTILKSIVAAALLSGSAAITERPRKVLRPHARSAMNPVTAGRSRPSNGRRIASVAQQLIAELREKQAAGMLTAEEQAWLARAEQRGGMCLTGTPAAVPDTAKAQGLGQGKGQGNGKGRCQGKRQGLRDGTGPRSVDGACPNGTQPRRGRGR
jgi:hypothetical protein